MKTRAEVKQLNKYVLPKKYKEGKKMHESVYISKEGYITKQEAEEELCIMQADYSEEKGWYCPKEQEGVFKDINGLWYAYRHHAKYKRRK